MSNDTLAKPAAQWAIGASGERLGAKMAKQSVSIFDSNGNTWWADRTSAAAIAEVAASKKTIQITKITTSEIDAQVAGYTIILNGSYPASLRRLA